MIRHIITTAFLVTAYLSSISSVCGQITSNDYEVYVPPFMSLQQLRPDQTATHPGTSANVRLAQSIWFARTGNPAGVTVTLATVTPFEHTVSSGVYRDARLRIPGFFGFGGWSIDKVIDQTDHASGKLNADVVASSQRPGFAWLPLEVTFLTGDVSTLTGGTYQMTVVGTITGN